MALLFSESFPDPEIQTIQGKTVETWHCSCGRELGELSALRSFEFYGVVMCPECWRKEHPVYGD